MKLEIFDDIWSELASELTRASFEGHDMEVTPLCGPGYPTHSDILEVTTVLLARDGRTFVPIDRSEEPAHVVRLASDDETCRALFATARCGWLATYLPSRPEGAVECMSCEGHGLDHRLGGGSALVCMTCHGRRWHASDYWKGRQ